jgi:hypothetical protein
MTLMFLVLGAVACVIAATGETGKLSKALSRQKHVKLVPKATYMFMATAQFAELVRTIDHISIVHVAAGLLLLAVVLATRSGTEELV